MIRRILDTIAVIAFVAFLPLMAVAQSGVSLISASPGAKPGQGTKTSCSVAGGVWRTSSPAATLDCGTGLTFINGQLAVGMAATTNLPVSIKANGTSFLGLSVEATGSSIATQIGSYLGDNYIASANSSTFATAPLYVSGSTFKIVTGSANNVTTNTRITVPADGGMQLSTGTKPTCNAAARGTLYYVAGGAGVADTYEVCVKDAADAYAWTSIF